MRRTTILGSFLSIDPATTALMTVLGIPNDGTVYYPATANEITGAEQWTAVNNLIVGLKSAGFWSRIYALWLHIGGTATTCKYNAKDPQDLDTSFRLGLSGGWIFGAVGSTGNGTNAFADTFFNPQTEIGAGTFGMFYFTDTLAIPASAESLFGANNTANTQFAQLWSATPANAFGRLRGSSGASFAGGLSNGLISIMRTGSTSLRLYLDDVVKGSDTTSSTGALPGMNIFMNARNPNNMGAVNYSGYNCQLSGFCDGFTPAEMTTFSALCHAFQTDMNR